MLSRQPEFPTSSPKRRLLYASIALAVVAGVCPSKIKAQSFILYDPNISASPQTVVSATLDELLVPSSYIVADGAEFSAFQFSGAAFGGAPTPTAADIMITAPTSTSPELEFQGGPFLALNTQLVDASLKFDVTELNANQKLTTAELFYTGATSGTGTLSVSEDVNDMNNNLLGEKSYVVQQGFSGSSNAGTITFAGQQEIQVSKDITLYGSATGDSASLSDFSQTFSAGTTPPVPEPSSIMMAILGSGGLGWFGWRRRGVRRRSTTHETASEVYYQTA
jgi:hypothetical protein